VKSVSGLENSIQGPGSVDSAPKIEASRPDTMAGTLGDPQKQQAGKLNHNACRHDRSHSPAGDLVKAGAEARGPPI